MKRISLTKGYEAIVSDEDYELVSAFKWRAQLVYRKDGTVRLVYAQRTTPRDTTGRQEVIHLHRFIAGLGKGDTRQVDHINHDPLDNRRENLRICSRNENQRNQKIQRGREFKGVHRCKSTGRWSAQLYVKGKHVWLGRHKTIDEAKAAYDKAAKEIFGEFAYTNMENAHANAM